jgi:serine/threonine protein phosphatase PrpC
MSRSTSRLSSKDKYSPFNRALGSVLSESSYSLKGRYLASPCEPKPIGRAFRLAELVNLSSRKLNQKPLLSTVRSKANLSTVQRIDPPKESPSRSTSLGRAVRAQIPKLQEGHLQALMTPSVLRCAYRTKKGTSGRTSKMHNQDSFLILPLTEKTSACYIFGVFDGHGAFGHLVSRYVKDAVAKYFTQHSSKLISHLTARNTLREGLSQACQELSFSGIDLSFSGTTACVIYICEHRILTANIGDSRAVIGGLRVKAFDLTTDHKPDIPLERNRILRRGGRVAQAKDSSGNPVGPSRVWLKSETYPGLAMSRSIGDTVAREAGVTSDPGKDLQRPPAVPDPP